MNSFLLRTLSAIREKTKKTRYLGGDSLPCFISIGKFGTFNNPFEKITSLSELVFRYSISVLLPQMIEKILIRITAAPEGENCEDQ